VDSREDSVGDLEVAVELVPLGDCIARVQEVACLDPPGGHHRSCAGEEVLHEDPAITGLLIPGRRKSVADPQRIREVIEAVDHQAVPEAVDALVEHERARCLQRQAKAPRDVWNLSARNSAERELHDSVVVPGSACHTAVAEGFRGVAVVAGIRGVTDTVRDLMAEGRDEGVRLLRAL
jgi:hypothetical protein